MKLEESGIHPIAVKIRSAIEAVRHSEDLIGEEAFLRMKNFPWTACTEACTVLGLYLKERYDLEPLIEKLARVEYSSNWGTHHWLEHDGIVIDITADQYDIVSDPVIVSRSSPFHMRFGNNATESSVIFRRQDLTNWELEFYTALIATLQNA